MKGIFGRSVMATALAGVFSAGMNSAFGAAFGLSEQSGSGLGNSYAGAAAVAEDASTMYFNPAGMSLLEKSQFAVAGHAISLDANFSGTATNPIALGGGKATGGDGGQIGSTGFVPNLYLMMPVGPKWSLGLGVNVPFALITEYDTDWVGRFQGVKSDIKTININPSVSYKVSDAVSIGAGVSYQQLDLELTNAVVLGAGEPGKGSLEADDDGWGWNIGAIFQLSPATRLGVAYRSEIDYTVEGAVTLTSDTGSLAGIGAAALFSGPATADVTTPDSLSLSIAHAASDRLLLLADATRTGWSSINQVNVVNPATGVNRDVLVLDFDDAWRYSIGGNYMLNDKWTLKAGLAFDETPVKNAETRTVRIPDNDRTWISFGGKMKLGQNGWLDLGYAHIFIKDADINHTNTPQPPVGAAGATTVTGTYKGSIDIFSVQYTVNF